MPGMKITLSAAMRARDVSRPAVSEDLARAEADAGDRRTSRPVPKPAPGRAPAEAPGPGLEALEATATTATGSRPRPEFTAADLEHPDAPATPAAQPAPVR